MRRADRLFQIVQILRRRRLTTARHLSEELEVSERTIYRDVRDLVQSGVPVDGEAGVGYRMGKNFELPPLMFNLEEVEALALGMRMVQKWGDRDLSRAARSIIHKLDTVLPESERGKLESTALFALSFRIGDEVRKTLRTCRRAVNERRTLLIDYTDPKGSSTKRTLRPLGLSFWGQTWTLAAYCELRKGFRNFRLDRIEQIRLGKDHFELAPPITLEDYVRAMDDHC
jgi:predicted DNA-binding transcriptional regulator YafY